jgi:hypothetical protein
LRAGGGRRWRSLGADYFSRIEIAIVNHLQLAIVDPQDNSVDLDPAGQNAGLSQRFDSLEDIRLDIVESAEPSAEIFVAESGARHPGSPETFDYLRHGEV